MLSGRPVMKSSVVVNGRTWNLFSFEFTTADGKFESYFYALSHEHAEMILIEMKETAKLSGQVIGSIKA